MDWLLEPFSVRWVNIVQLIYLSIMFFGVVLLRKKSQFAGLRVFLALQIPLMALNFLEELQLSLSVLLTPLLTLTTGPGFYLFVRHLSHAQKKLNWRDLVHFCPLLLMAPLLHCPQWLIAFGSISLIAYGVWVIKIQQTYQKAISQMTSEVEEMNLDWLSHVIWLFIFVGATDLVRLNLQPVLPYAVMNTWYVLHQALVLLLFCYVIIKAVDQEYVYADIDQFIQLQQQQKQTQEHASVLFEQIHQQIIDQQWYLVPRFSLKQLALKTGLQEKDVSWAINQGSQQSFNEYINQLRIQHFIQLQKDDDNNSSLLELALASGFNSKSSFNAIFKKVMRMTPSEYSKLQH